MGFDKLKKGFFGEDKDIDDEDDVKSVVKTSNNSANYSSNMILCEPRSYSESQQIADHLRNNSGVIVKLQRVTPDIAKRIIDFLSGTIYALDGNLQKLGGGIFLCTPKNYNVEGKISDESQSKISKKPKEEKSEEDVEW